MSFVFSVHLGTETTNAGTYTGKPRYLVLVLVHIPTKKRYRQVFCVIDNRDAFFPKSANNVAEPEQ